VEVRSEDIGVFIYGAILYDSFATFTDPDDLPEPAVQKIDLQVERPSLHIFIEAI
jgi:hypothetical protein